MLQLPTTIRRFRPQNRNPRQLPVPALSTVRVAQVTPCACTLDAAQSFSRDRWDELEAFRPGVLVGSAADLRGLAELVQRDILDLASVDHALFVLTECGEQPVSDVSRVVLWQTFGVPLFELFVSAGGMLLASECEAHEGWHVESGAVFSLYDGELILDGPGLTGLGTGLTGRIDIEVCPCGRPGMRLTEIEALVPTPERAFAATA